MLEPELADPEEPEEDDEPELPRLVASPPPPPDDDEPDDPEDVEVLPLPRGTAWPAYAGTANPTATRKLIVRIDLVMACSLGMGTF